MEINWDDIDDSIDELSFKGEVKYGKVVSVYDCDKFKIVFLLNGKLYKWHCRLNNVDTPQLKAFNDPEKELAYYIRHQIKEKILNQIVKIKCGEFDENGRILVEIYINEKENLNQWLVDNKMAFEYNGGTKKNWNQILENTN